jgi:hypothetical protein
MNGAVVLPPDQRVATPGRGPFRGSWTIGLNQSEEAVNVRGSGAG